jgi:Cof subfamily protein (haloacid dehalogenase superfamily)
MKRRRRSFQSIENMTISLVVSDVDATLITPEHEITTRTARAVRQLQKRGIGFTMASSRPPRGLYDFAEQLNLTEPFAAFNGGVIQKRSGETLLKHTLSREICQAAFEITGKFGIGLWLYCDHDWHVDKITPFVEREQKTIGFPATVENDLKDVFGTAAKLVMVGDPTLIALAEPIALAEFGVSVSATKSKPRFLDITAKEAHKGTVITQLAAVMGIPTAEVAVIGDGLNDVLMFERAGFSIAMGQSSDEVKAAANIVTKSNTDEGFAFAIEKFILEN